MQKRNPRLEHLLQKIRNLHRLHGTIVSSNYDITDDCNLTCEGCLYFSGLGYKRRPATSAEAWEAFFAEESARGVNFGYFAGAEPSLVPEVLRVAAKHIHLGVVFTNGIKKIPEDIRYRIHLSLWGNSQDNQMLRGADNSLKALRNYSGDPRAIAVYTINRRNIDSIELVAGLCADHGLPITFSYFSPTDDYLARSSGHLATQTPFFRGNLKDGNLMLRQEDFRKAHQSISKAKQTHKSYVIYSLAYDAWITQPNDIYRLNEHNVAIDCGNRISRDFRHYNVDLSLNKDKCCSPNLDCKQCRAYTNGYSTLLSRFPQFRRNADSLQLWTETWELWRSLFLPLEHQGDAIASYRGINDGTTTS